MDHTEVSADQLPDTPTRAETPGMARKIAWITTGIWYALVWLTITIWVYMSFPIEGFYDYCHGTAGTAYPQCTGAEETLPVWQPPFLALIPALVLTLPFIVVSLLLTIRHRKQVARTLANTLTPGETPTRAPRTGWLYALLTITSLLLVAFAGLLIYGTVDYIQREQAYDSKFETRYSSNPDRTECTTWEVVKDGIGASAPTPINCADIPDWYWEQQNTN